MRLPLDGDAEEVTWASSSDAGLEAESIAADPRTTVDLRNARREAL